MAVKGFPTSEGGGTAPLAAATGPVTIPGVTPPAARSPPGRVVRSLGGVVLLLRVLRANILSLVGFVMVVVLVVTAVLVTAFPSVLPFAPYPYYTSAYQSPPNLTYWFGTDNLRRNVFSLALAGLPIDLSVALFISGVAVLIGGTLGLVSGYWDRPGTAGGAASTIILRVTDIFLAFPSLVLALAVVAALGHGALQSTLAILFTWWPFYVRLVRGEVLAVKHLPYITAAKAAGVSDGRIILRHIVRNIAEPLVVYFTMDIGTVIVTLATISYIGVGFNPPEWGAMFSNYTDKFLIIPWALLGIGFMIFITVLAFSLLGDGLRDVLDPRSRRILSQAAVVSQTAAQESPELGPALPSETPEGVGSGVAA